MKKAVLWLVICLLVFSWTNALAETPTVDEVFAGQIRDYALKGTANFSVLGEETGLVESGLFQMLKESLPGISVSFGHSMYEKKYPGGYVRFNGADGEEKEILFAYNDDVIALGGNTVSDDDTWYAVEKEMTKVLGLFEEQDENALPGIREIMAAMEKADDAWKEKAAERLSAYETALSIWMNQYAVSRTGREGDILYSELACEIPTDAVKAEIRGLLQLFYSDEETLQLLSQVLEPIGAGIYLNPAMESLLSMLAENAMPDGVVQVVRRFDPQGTLVLDKISLPLPAFENWQQVSVEITGKGDLGFSLSDAQGKAILFSLVAGEEGHYTGSVALDNMMEAYPHIGFDFDFSWQVMEETYSLQEDKLERLKQGVLTLTPDKETLLPAQRITLDVSYSSDSGERSVVTMQADMVWMDIEKGASLAAAVKAKAANRFEVTKMEDIKNILYFSDVPAGQRQALLSHILLAPFESMWPTEEIQ